VAIRFEGGKFQPLPDGYPKQPINFFTSKVGAGSDIFIRQLTTAAQPLSPVPLVVKNMTGGPADYFKAARDANKEGYAVSYSSGSFVAENYIEGHNLVFGKDFNPVAFINTADTVMPVKADAPWKTAKEFLDYAKANPGQRVATSTSGSMHHVVCEWVAKEYGIKWTCVPHDSSGDAVRGIIAGDFVSGIITLAAVQPQADAGKVRVLATASDKLTKHPDSVRFTDMGLKVQYDHFYGVLAPGEVPQQRVDWLAALLVKAAENPDYQKWTDSQGQRVLGYTSDKALAMLKNLDPIAERLTKELGMR